MIMKSPFTFIYSAPTNIVEGKKYPAIFLLHGMGSNEEDLPQLVQELKEDYFIFSLQGPILQEPGYAFYHDKEFGKPDRHVFDQVVIHIAKFIEEAATEFPLNLKELYILGFSQGAVLANSLAFVMGNQKLAGVVALSGYIPDFVKTDYKKKSVDSLPIYIAHGTMDYVLPYQWGEESKGFFLSYDAEVTFKGFEDGHGVPPYVQEEVIQFFKKKSSNQ